MPNEPTITPDAIDIASREASATHLVVVADRFSNFSSDDRVRTVSGLCSAIAAGQFDDTSDDVLLHPGQGITPHERADIDATLQRRGLEDRVRLQPDDLQPAGRGVVHKHRPENVLLTDVRRVSEHDYDAGLCVHGHNELLLDHQTGYHVQGMVVIEAARQMFLAAFEVGYRHRWPMRSYYVIWNSVQLTFTNFLFPLPARVTCTLSELNIANPNKLEYGMQVEIHQAGQVVVTGDIAFTSFETKRIASLERRRATAALDACIEHVASHSEAGQRHARVAL